MGWHPKRYHQASGLQPYGGPAAEWRGSARLTAPIQHQTPQPLFLGVSTGSSGKAVSRTAPAGAPRPAPAPGAGGGRACSPKEPQPQGALAKKRGVGLTWTGSYYILNVGFLPHPAAQAELPRSRHRPSQRPPAGPRDHHVRSSSAPSKGPLLTAPAPTRPTAPRRQRAPNGVRRRPAAAGGRSCLPPPSPASTELGGLCRQLTPQPTAAGGRPLLLGRTRRLRCQPRTQLENWKEGMGARQL